MSPEERARAALVAELFASATDCDTAEQEALLDRRCGADDEVRRKVEALLRAARRAGEFMESAAVDFAGETEPEGGALSSGDRVGNYEIVSLIGRGGMGEVYLAKDQRVNRQVALKLVRGGFDRESLTRNFQREQQLLAGLNHPNIAQLYETGVTATGSPFFVMEYVRGSRLDEFVHQTSLNLPARLSLFRKVCAAIAYAHQHLVIHRDIKPANILVTPEREPKLLDFGIARLLDEMADDARDQTVTMQRMLTPEYASPEQVRGERISTASDIYSLGVVLYELLTGTKPYRLTSRRPDEVTRAITEEQPVRPSEHRELPIARSLRGDLDNIVLLALRKEPERRYNSVAAFSDDIARFLDGLPVRARKDTLSYRASRFVRRNRLAVAAAALVLLTLVGGIIASGMQARRAERERARAEKRFADVRALAHSLLFEILPKFLSVPGTTEARDIATKRAFEYLDSLAREAGNDLALQHELAVAYRALADLSAIGKGDYAQSRESRRKALAIQEKLLQAQPNDPAVQDETARDYQGEAWSSWISGETARALAVYEKCLALREALFAAHPENFDYVYRLGHVHLTKGELLLSIDRTSEARHLFTRALSLMESLRSHADAARQQVRLQRGLLWSHNALGDTYVAEQNWEGAMRDFDAAAQFAESMYANQPNDINAIENLTRTYVGQAKVYAAAQKFTEAEAKLRRCLEIHEAAPKTDAYNRAPIAKLHSELAGLKMARGDSAGANDELQTAQVIGEELVTGAPRNFSYLSNLAEVCERLGALNRAKGEIANARTAYRRALALREQLASDQGNPRAQRDLARCTEALRELQ